VDIPNQKVVNPSQSDDTFKDISEDNISNINIRNKGSKPHS
jgi:hypothetical protein